jgi:hypothetical protein
MSHLQAKTKRSDKHLDGKSCWSGLIYKLKRDLVGPSLFYFVGLILAPMVPTASEACTMSRDPKANIYFRYDSGAFGFYGGGNETPPPSAVDNCQGNEGKFLMITTGVRRQGFSSDVDQVSFDGTWRESQCRLADSPVPLPVDSAATTAVIKEQHRILRSCVGVAVSSVGNTRLDVPPNPKCKVNRVSPKEVVITGDACFVPILPRMRLAVGLKINPECATAAFLRENSIPAMDVEAVLSTFVAGDATGFSPDVESVGFRRFRVTVTPDEKLMPLAEEISEGRPRFPSTYIGDIHPGDVTVQEIGDREFSLRFSWLMRNVAPSRCLDGVCASPAGFSLPTAAEVRLFRVVGDERESIHDWMQSEVVFPQWNGLVPGDAVQLEPGKLEIGGRYVVQARFIDPYEDYRLAESRVQQLLIDLSSFSGKPGVGQIGSIEGLTPLTGLPNLGAMPQLGVADPNSLLNQFQSALRFLGRFQAERSWPQFFEQICDITGQNCLPAGKQPKYTEVETEFTLGDLDPMTAEAKLTDIRIRRTSPLGGNYDQAVNGLPRIACN